ncbi:MAG: hydrogenase expression/formation C-terminal domain-containing protein [Pseudomonadota bacterium]
MQKLESIGVRVEPSLEATGNLLPVLHEILHALRQFTQTGEPTVIDLAAIPFAPGDEENLMEMLGGGEIRITVDSLGPTYIRETRYHGVWLVDYRSEADDRIGLQIEITDIPSLVRTPTADLGDAAAALQRFLSED